MHDFEGFRNAIQYDINQPIQDTLVILAKQGNAIVAMAGASETLLKNVGDWGTIVLPEYRNNGLAVYLVNALTIEILKRNIVPCYGTSSSNIASQKVAYRAGFMPAWTIGYRVRFEGRT